MNRLAWLGHAGTCFALGVPEDCTREAWHNLSMVEQDLANKNHYNQATLLELRDSLDSTLLYQAFDILNLSPQKQR